MNENMTMEDLMNDFELKHFHKGDVVKGKIVSINNDEVIVNIWHFVDGIIPKNELSNNKDFDINLLNIDDEVYVMVLSGDDGEGNVLLSKKRADSIKIWDDIKESMNQGNLVNVTLKEVVKGGIVGDLNGIRVFMPASQCSAQRITNLETLVGKTLEVRVIEFEKSKNKVGAQQPEDVGRL